MEMKKQDPGRDFREKELVLKISRSGYRSLVVDSRDAAEKAMGLLSRKIQINRNKMKYGAKCYI